MNDLTGENKNLYFSSLKFLEYFDKSFDLNEKKEYLGFYLFSKVCFCKEYYYFSFNQFDF